jgi:hypothetical protein
MIVYTVVDAVEADAVEVDFVMVTIACIVADVEIVAAMLMLMLMAMMTMTTILMIACTVVGAAERTVVAYMVIAAVMFVCTAGLLVAGTEHKPDSCLPFSAVEMG